jgi:hypothetical protein
MPSDPAPMGPSEAAPRYIRMLDSAFSGTRHLRANAELGIRAYLVVTPMSAPSSAEGKGSGMTNEPIDISAFVEMRLHGRPTRERQTRALRSFRAILRRLTQYEFRIVYRQMESVEDLIGEGTLTVE